MSSTNQFPIVPVSSHEDVINDAALFMETLTSFHISLGTKLIIPFINRKPLDLHSLYVEVTNRGGFEQVVNRKKWKEVSKALSVPSTNASYVLKRHYLSLLHRYEEAYFRLPGAAPVLPQNDPVQVEVVIDGQFEHGFSVSAKVNGRTLKGVLYYETACAGSSPFGPVPQPCTDVVQYVVPDLNLPAPV